MIVGHSPPAPSRTSAARHLPAAGEATSANQKYGGPPCRSRDLTAIVPSGARSESSPLTGISAAMSTRNGAPVHGATGEGRTATSASQPPDRRWARASTPEQSTMENVPVTSNAAVTAPAASCRGWNNGAPIP